MERYEASGRFGAVLLPAVLACVAVGVGLAWVYQWLIDVIPFIYVNVLLTIGFGFVLLYLVIMALQVGRNRNRALALVAAVVVPLAAQGASFWWAYRSALPDVHAAVSEQAKRDGNEVAPLDEFDQYFTFDDWRELRVETGWSVGRVASSSGRPTLSGFFVYAIWLIEAAILVGLCVMGVSSQAQEPFCEHCGVWHTSEPLGPWAGIDAKRLRDAVRDEQIPPLLAPVPAATGSEEQGAFVLHDCPSCQGSPFLDVAVARREKGKDGKLETKTEVLAKGLALTGAQRDALRKYAYPAAPRSKGLKGGIQPPTP